MDGSLSEQILEIEDPEASIGWMVHRMAEAFKYDGRATDTVMGFSGRIYTAELWDRMDQAGTPRHER